MLSSMSFAITHRQAHTHKPADTQSQVHTHTHTLLRVPFLQAVALLILSDLKFVCSLLQRAPSMIPGSARAPLHYHPSTFISLTPPVPSSPEAKAAAELPLQHTHTYIAHIVSHKKMWKIMKYSRTQ